MHLIIFDIGARGGLKGIIPGWLPSARPFGSFMTLFDAYGFEPDPSELNKLERSGDYKHVYDWAVGRVTGPANLYITREPDKSSTLEPNIDLIRQCFGGDAEGYEVKKVVPVFCRNLDEITEDISVCQIGSRSTLKETKLIF